MHRALLVLSLALFACNTDAAETPADAPMAAAPGAGGAMPAGHPPMGGMGGMGMGAPGGGQAPVTLSGTVQETMTSGGYTYALLETADAQVWVAGPATEGIEVGDAVGVPDGMLMKDFASPTLDRTFPEIFFVGALVEEGAAAAAAPATAGPGAITPDAQEGVSVEAAQGGVTVADVWARSAELTGQEVAVRGKVVKFNANILGSNWLHIQDGSGDAATGDHDLTVTSAGTAAVGDVVLVTGPVSTNRDFGMGYSYAVMVEGASITAE